MRERERVSECVCVRERERVSERVRGGVHTSMKEALI